MPFVHPPCDEDEPASDVMSDQTWRTRECQRVI
jgi:hypothetical protein